MSFITVGKITLQHSNALEKKNKGHRTKIKKKKMTCQTCSGMMLRHTPIMGGVLIPGPRCT